MILGVFMKIENDAPKWMENMMTSDSRQFLEAFVQTDDRWTEDDPEDNPNFFLPSNMLDEDGEQILFY